MKHQIVWVLATAVASLAAGAEAGRAGSGSGRGGNGGRGGGSGGGLGGGNHGGAINATCLELVEDLCGDACDLSWGANVTDLEICLECFQENAEELGDCVSDQIDDLECVVEVQSSVDDSCRAFPGNGRIAECAQDCYQSAASCPNKTIGGHVPDGLNTSCAQDVYDTCEACVLDDLDADAAEECLACLAENVDDFVDCTDLDVFECAAETAICYEDECDDLEGLELAKCARACMANATSCDSKNVGGDWGSGRGRGGRHLGGFRGGSKGRFNGGWHNHTDFGGRNRTDFDGHNHTDFGGHNHTQGGGRGGRGGRHRGLRGDKPNFFDVITGNHTFGGNHIFGGNHTFGGHHDGNNTFRGHHGGNFTFGGNHTFSGNHHTFSGNHTFGGHHGGQAGGRGRHLGKHGHGGHGGGFSHLNMTCITEIEETCEACAQVGHFNLTSAESCIECLDANEDSLGTCAEALADKLTCKVEVQICLEETCADLTGKERRTCKKECRESATSC